VKNIINASHQLTVWEVAEKTGISTGSRHTILTEDLGMECVSEKFVPWLLTEYSISFNL
jgi:hypothetical protein